MTEPEPKNQNAISLYCPDCKNKIPPEVLEDNNDPNAVCCPLCGVIIPIEPQTENLEKTQEEREENTQIKIIQLSLKNTAKWHLKLLLYFSIYDLLYSKVRVFTKVKKQKHLGSLTIKRYAKQLRSKLLKSPISRDLMTKLNPREQKKLKRVYHLFKESIKDEKQFKIYQIQAFMDGIQFIFDVMRGDYEFVTFSSTEKEIIMELKDKVNPFKDMRSKRSLGREFTIIFARIIHHYLFAFSRTNETLTHEVVKELVDGVIDQLSAQDSVEWIESQINIKLNRRERYNFKVTRLCLNIDWIQREYYSDLLVMTVESVHALMNDMANEVPMSGLSRILLQGFEESELFRLDKAFSNREKLNITIVLARMIHAHISAAFPSPRQANPNQKLPPALHRDISATILEGLIEHLEINSDFLLRFYNFSLDKFHTAREKLFEKLEGDMIYRASFTTFLTNLIETVFKLIRQEPKESKLSPLELRIQEDLELYPYDWRNRNVKLFEDEKATESIEPSDDLTIKMYTVKEFTDELMKKLDQFPEEMYKLNPARAQKGHSGYTLKDLSKLWGYLDGYVSEKLSYYRNRPNYILPHQNLAKLEINIKKIYGEKAEPCIKLLESHKTGNLSLNLLIEKLREELGKISTRVCTTLEDLALIFNYGYGMMSYMRQHDEFFLTKEKLQIIRKNLHLILGKKAKSVIALLDKYERLNPDLLDYANQKYTISNSDFFSNPHNPDVMYWFGWLCSDGWVSQDVHYQIQLKLKRKDRIIVEKFASVIGYDQERIYDEIYLLKSKNGKIRKILSSRVIFGCKPMWDDLNKLGIFEFKTAGNVPSIIRDFIRIAKSKNPNGVLMDSEEGKLALNFLMGFYDGDGNYRGGMSARILNTKKEFLEEISDLFDIPNEVNLNNKAKLDLDKNKIIWKKRYQLHFGKIIFTQMLLSYKDSLQRKRPDQYKLT